MGKYAAWVATPLVLALLVLIWQFYVVVFEVSPFILPPPLAVWHATVELLSEPKTYSHIAITVYETVAGFLIAVVINCLGQSSCFSAASRGFASISSQTSGMRHSSSFSGWQR